MTKAHECEVRSGKSVSSLGIVERWWVVQTGKKKSKESAELLNQLEDE